LVKCPSTFHIWSMIRIISCIILLCYTLLPLSAQIQLLNDEFDDSRSVVNWHNINVVEQWGIAQLETYSIDSAVQDKLQMIPRTASWFGGWRGPLLYKEVSGDFIFTTKVDIIGRDAAIPEDDFNLGGVMVRHVRDYPDGALDPVTGWIPADNNYLFLSIGAARNNDGRCDPDPSDCFAPHFEVKSTINGNSTLDIQNIDTTSTQIRVARIGDVFIVLYRLETDQTWVVHRRFNRSDFPDTIQVGFVTYTDWAKVSSYAPAAHNRTQIEGDECNSGPPCDPDVIGEFDFARFDSLVVPMGIGSDFNNPSDVTDAELLSFLDYSSAAFCPQVLRVDSPVPDDTFQKYAASQEVILENVIGVNSIVHVSAPDSVRFLSGFQNVNSSLIEVDLEGCN